MASEKGGAKYTLVVEDGSATSRKLLFDSYEKGEKQGKVSGAGVITGLDGPQADNGHPTNSILQGKNDIALVLTVVMDNAKEVDTVKDTTKQENLKCMVAAENPTCQVDQRGDMVHEVVVDLITTEFIQNIRWRVEPIQLV